MFDVWNSCLRNLSTFNILKFLFVQSLQIWSVLAFLISAYIGIEFIYEVVSSTEQILLPPD
jgi:hypothetical protein